MSEERGVMSSEEADHVSPWEVTPTVGEGTLGTWRFPGSVGGRLDKTGAVAGRCPGDEAVGKPRSQGVCEPALEPWRRGKGLWRKSQDFQPDRGNPAVRPYRGATGNVAMVGMRTRLAIERAGTVTPHLKRGAPVLYPKPNGNGEQWIGRTYGAMAPVLDPTRQRFL